MARIRVRMMGSLRMAMGRDEIELTLESSVEVAQVIHMLFKELGEDLSDPRDALAEALILINGIEINNLEGLRTPVIDGDLLVILPVAHGG